MQNFINRDMNLPINNANLLSKKEKWLNKDRLWNFVFWFGMSFGLALAGFLKGELKIINLGNLIALSTLVGVPLLVWFFNRTRFTSENKIVNSEGNEITKDQLPYSWPFATICGPILAFGVAETLLSKQHIFFLENFILFLCMFSGFSLYFIFKNCPINILFNKHTWSMRTTGMFATPQESAEFGVKLFNVVDNLDAKLKSEQNK